MSKEKKFNSKYYDKFKQINSKIGREHTSTDTKKIINYVALNEFLEQFKDDTKKEGEFLHVPGKNKDIKNPNKEIIRIIETMISDLDHELRLSYYPPGL